MEQILKAIEEQYGLVHAGILAIVCAIIAFLSFAVREVWIHKKKNTLDKEAEKQDDINELTSNFTAEQRDLLLCMGMNPRRRANVILSKALEKNGKADDDSIEVFSTRVDITFPCEPYWEALRNLQERYYLASPDGTRFTINEKGVRTAERLNALGFVVSSKARFKS